MRNELQLVTSRNFDGIIFDCYVERGQTSPQDFWATRTQIGELLEYAEPGNAIKNIHQRNKERLDKFSRVAQIELPSGGSQEVVLYNFKGLLEICRYSQQPNAHKVIDILWDIADEIRRTGSYNTRFPEKDNETERMSIRLECAKFLQRMIDYPSFPLTDESKAVIQHEAFKIITGHEYLGMLPAMTEKWYSASDIATIIGLSGNMVGRIANENGIKATEGESNKYGRWTYSKSRYSGKEVPQFIYNENAVEWFIEHKKSIA